MLPAGVQQGGLAAYGVAYICWCASMMAIHHGSSASAVLHIFAACHGSCRTYVLGTRPLHLDACEQIWGCLWGRAHFMEICQSGFTPLAASHCHAVHQTCVSL